MEKKLDVFLSNHSMVETLLDGLNFVTQIIVCLAQTAAHTYAHQLSPMPYIIVMLYKTKIAQGTISEVEVLPLSLFDFVKWLSKIKTSSFWVLKFNYCTHSGITQVCDIQFLLTNRVR